MDTSAFTGGVVVGVVSLGFVAFCAFLVDLMTNHRCPYTTNWGHTQCVLPRNHPEPEHQEKRQY